MSQKKDSTATAVNVTIRLDQATVDCLKAFCDKTRRARADVIRAAIDLFLADGEQAAEMRLTQKLWPPPTGEPGKSDQPVIAMRERHPAQAGRQLVVYTPAGYKGSPEELKQAVRKALDTDTLKIEKRPVKRTGTRGK